MLRTTWVVLAVFSVSCGGSQYSYSRRYQTADGENQFLEESQDLTYEDVRRDPASYRATRVSWFGVVTSVTWVNEGTGEALVGLTHRVHRPRHLCADETEGSCRVTITDRPSGPFSFRGIVRVEDRGGQKRLAAGSLVRVYGHPTADFDADGGPILDAEFYRHFPFGTYVTTGDAGHMRR